MIIRREHRRNYTTIANEVVEDERLSYDAVGLLSYLLSRPDNWEVRIEQLRDRGKIGKDKMYRIIGELQTAGYLRHEARRTEQGTISGSHWIVREEPCSEAPVQPEPELSLEVEQNSNDSSNKPPHPDFPDAGLTASGSTASGLTGIRETRTLTKDSLVTIPEVRTPSLRSGVRETPPSSAEIARQGIVIFNQAAVECDWPQAQRLTNQRKAALLARIRESGGLEGWRAAMAKARASPFLRGELGRGEGHEHWRPTLDFFIRAQVFTKLMEGGYDGKAEDARRRDKGPHDAIFRALAERAEERSRRDRGQAAADGGSAAGAGRDGEDRWRDR